ncbi:MAG TPA: glycosyltransferase family 4 protein [Methylophilus sp.]
MQRIFTWAKTVYKRFCTPMLLGAEHITSYFSWQAFKQDFLTITPEWVGSSLNINDFSSYRHAADSPFGVMPFIVDAHATKHQRYYDAWSVAPSKASKLLHVMFIGLRGFPNVQGGIESHVEHLAPLLVSYGCQVEVVVRTPYQPHAHANSWRGVALTRIWSPKSNKLEVIMHTFLGVMYAAIKRPDILHIQAIGPALMTPLARLLGLKVIVTHHGPDYDRQKWGRVARSVLKLGEWLGMRFAHGRIVISHVIRDLVAHKHAVDAEIICNGVEIPSLDCPDTLLNQFGLQKNRYILIVSRLVPEKRHLDLINAFNLANIPNCKLAIVGSSDHPDGYVQQLVSKVAHNPNIVLTGFQKGEVLNSLYAHAGLFVLPSSHEGLSISLLEALSYGLKVLVSDIPANKVLALKDYSYFAMGDVQQLSVKLTECMQQPNTYEAKLVTRAWVASQYNWRSIAESTYKHYQKLLNAI